MANPEDIRNKAAQVRATAKSQDGKKNKTIQIIGGLFVLILVVGLIGAGVYVRGQSQGQSITPELITEYNSSAQLPKGVSAQEGYGIPVGKQDPNSPRAELYEDFQCPACGFLEKANGKNIIESAVKGDINLTLHPMIFLDRNYPESQLSSLRATMAFGCAADAGKTAEFHSGVFELQPAKEGDGFSNQQLLDLGKKVGIQGSDYTTFETCLTTEKYKGWAQNSQLHAQDRGVQGTPSFYLNGTQIENSIVADPAGFAGVVAEAQK
jgi:protein-disulfide isomerase